MPYYSNSSAARLPVPSNSTQSVPHHNLKDVPYFTYHDGEWYGMLCLAVVLLINCALMAGLILAVCGLNPTFLQLRSITGNPKQRQQALVVARMKRHHSWMLCSLIICSVLCGEYLPFVIQGLWDRQDYWVPIIISTLSIAFFAEIVPQYWIPRRAIEWGYYCWPVIWGCMWLTCIFSWPLSKLLDCCSGRRDELSLFSNDELAGLIKYHEKSEKHGGSLGQDTARVVLGALSLDGHRIGANFSPFSETRSSSSNENGSDVEKANLVIVHGMIVNWSVVKTVDIDEPVDKAFIKKIKSWSYSRIPVVGEAQVEQAEPGKNPAANSSWDAKKVFGFLHVKNLIGLKIDDKHDSNRRLVVRDLPLYPLPIVMDDMPAYSLLNMFHLGMSRMAIVIPTPSKAAISEIVIPKKSASSGGVQAPCWTGTQRTNTRIKSRLSQINAQTNWTNRFLDGVLKAIENGKHNVVGIRCPEPVGIITFEDIIDTILQKTSRDERDFYDRDNAPPKTKGKKVGDFPPISTICEDRVIPAYIPGKCLPPLGLKENNTIRKRNPSNKDRTGMDGAAESSNDTGNEIYDRKKHYVESSYTQSSRGGFHDDIGSSSSIQNVLLMSPEERAAFSRVPPPTPVNAELQCKTASLPTRKEASPFLPGDWNPYTRRYVSAMPNLPALRRVTPFSRQDYSSFEKKPDPEYDETQLIMPSPSMLAVPPDYRFGANVSGIDISDTMEDSCVFNDAGRGAREDSEDTISISSWRYSDPYDIDDLNSRAYNTSFAASALANIHDVHVHIPSTVAQETTETSSTPFSNPSSNFNHSPVVPYEGFPPELLDQPKENQVPDFASRTLPRLSFAGGLDGSNDRRDCDTLVREGSFHDDRALLPSQKRAWNGSMGLGGMRSTSFWF